MKKFFSLILLTLSIASLSFGMEENSNNNNESVATVITADGQEILIHDSKELEALQQAKTIANFLEFLDENEKVIDLPEVTSDQFNKILPLLTIIHENKLNPEQAHEKLMQHLNRKNSNKQSGIKEGKQEEDEPTIEYTTNDLIELLKTANYLDISLLFDCCIELLAEKLVTPNELKQFIEDPECLTNISNLPIELNQALVNKMPINYWILSKKLGIDFTCKTFKNPQNEPKSAALPPEGSLLASVFNNAVNIYIIEKNDIKLLTTLDDHTDWINSIEFSPDGSLFASGSNDNTVKIYTIDPQNDIKLLTTLDDHTDLVKSVAFSPDGSLFASGSKDKTVKIYSIKKIKKNNTKPLATLNDHTNYISSVTFSPDGNLLASASWDATIKIYSIKKIKENNTPLATLNHKASLSSVTFSHDSCLLISRSYSNTLKVYNLRSLSKDLLVEPLLFLALCINNNQSIELYKYPHLQPIFDSLPEVIKNKLIENNLVKAPWSSYLNYSWSILKNGL